MLVQQSPPLCYCVLTGRLHPWPEYTDQPLQTLATSAESDAGRLLVFIYVRLAEVGLGNRLLSDRQLHTQAESQPVSAVTADFG